VPEATHAVAAERFRPSSTATRPERSEDVTTGAPAVPDSVSVFRSPSPRVIWALALAGCGVASFSFVSAFYSETVTTELGEPLVVALLVNWNTIAYVLCGLVAWSRRPASRFGPLLVAAGFVNFLTTLSWTTNDVPYTIGQTLDFIPPILFLHVFLAYPTGRLETRVERVIVVTGYIVAISLELVRMAAGGFGPHNLLEVASYPWVAMWALRAQLIVIAALVLAGVAVLAYKRRRAGRHLRRSAALLVDSFGLGLLMIAVLFLSIVFSGPAVKEIRWATLATIGLAPVAFLIGLLYARLARSAVGGLLVELQAEPAPADLRDALARALGDQSLTLAYWLPDFRTYVDLDGRRVVLTEEAGRTTTVIERNGARVAALQHDSALIDEPELLGAVTAAAAIAFENARLHAELRARLEELRGSRARVIEAGQTERQRLERNLHDGAQQRLIALSLELSLLEDELDGDPQTTARLAEARAEIAASLEELREVARGLHPAVVSAHGLEVALEQLVARAAVPVTLTVQVGPRLPESLEVAAFYLVSESLANVAKYAEASTASVEGRRRDADLLVEVADDGVGGADESRGSGLRGLADRVEALGGKLRVWSPAGGGTRVRAEIPCAP
jgi:signal transduction histidine kinase